MADPLDDLCGPGKASRVLDKCRHTRNLGEYEGPLEVDERLVDGLLQATRAVVQALNS